VKTLPPYLSFMDSPALKNRFLQGPHSPALESLEAKQL
jgi:hypothetical protein